MPPEIFFTRYERRLQRRLKQLAQSIRRIYSNAIIEVSIEGAKVKYKSEGFNIDLYPSIKKKIDDILREMQSSMTSTIQQAVRDIWSLSNKKNDSTVRTITGKYTIPPDLENLLFDPNRSALKAFETRKVKGMRLSRRVWEIVKPFRHELEAGLSHGIRNGTSAAGMATDLKRYLREPDKLFRRVRDKETGELKLSRQAKQYTPGRGIYRSSFKNALRLSRTETNMAYRKADQLRWRANPLVLGYRIKLSDSHPKYDICDPLAGDYPKDFNWPGWHPQCLCYSVPILPTPEQMEQREDYTLGLTNIEPKFEYVKDVPQAFKDYVSENRERIEGWKSKPYWMRDNAGYVN